MEHQPIPNWAIHMRFYRWVLGFAKTPLAPIILFVIAFVEAFMPFVPPDALLIPMCLEKRSKSPFIALIAVFGSVAGAMVGFFVIAGLIQGGAEWILSEAKVAELTEQFSEYGIMFVFIAALTVVPFFALTTVAGVANLDFTQFIFVCFAGRSLRYGLEAGLIMWLGDRAKEFIEKRFNILSILVCVLAIVFVYGVSKWLY